MPHPSGTNRVRFAVEALQDPFHQAIEIHWVGDRRDDVRLARCGQPRQAVNLLARLAGREPMIDLRPLKMLAGAARSGH